ncbi:hypothetical protein O181_096413 [Austropuccinia psidii MF-1]|uniref:RNase H type-1 domain-containing protein n=1 Tax=Austropuccinia psidii MF-1 TaxID=1389203 RepID=A0A9Q3PC59_9BASI|nr:hypothetical protein [Austropuccinia psidii MF-1]
MEVMTRSKSWGLRYRAIFDEKKTNFIIFTKRKQPLEEMMIAETPYPLRKEIHSKPKTHPSPLNILIEKRALLQQHSTRAETLLSFPVPLWTEQLTSILNLHQKKTQAKVKIPEQITEELKAGTLVLFANGSLIPDKGGGAAAILTNTSKKIITYVGRDSIVTNFKTEMMALSLCQELLSNYINDYGFPPAVAIFSNSQTALKSLTLPKKKSPGQYLTAKIFSKFKTWSPCISINLYWFPGHIGIQQNEEVNKLAKEAARSTTPSHYMPSKVSPSQKRNPLANT